MRMAVKAEKFLTELFQAFITTPDTLPTPIREKLQTEDKFRIVCDYLAGMTDRFALEEHQKMFDPHTRS
jgi:dGTPase